MRHGAKHGLRGKGGETWGEREEGMRQAPFAA